MAKMLIAVLAATVTVGSLPVQKFETPIGALPLTDDQVPLAEAFIAKVDASDAVPSDGMIEEAFGKSFPVKLDWLFVHLRENVKLDTRFTVRLADVTPDVT